MYSEYLQVTRMVQQFQQKPQPEVLQRDVIQSQMYERPVPASELLFQQRYD
jgi:hypothetical protein